MTWFMRFDDISWSSANSIPVLHIEIIIVYYYYRQLLDFFLQILLNDIVFL